jgi:hypothetical protein
VAREALVGVEARSEAVVAASRYHLDFCKPVDPVLEKGGFVGSKVIQGIAGPWRSAPHSRIDRPFDRFAPGASAWHYQGCENESKENFYSRYPSSIHDPTSTQWKFLHRVSVDYGLSSCFGAL